MDPPEVRFAKSGNVHIAYQVVGTGPIDLVLAFSAISQLEVMWDHPLLVRQYERISEFARLILFDKRGVGLSDRDMGFATLEESIDDIRAVLDAVGSPRAVLFGTLDGTALSILYSATYPDKTVGLVLWGGQARTSWAPDYPWAKSREAWEADLRRDEAEWGSRSHIERVVAQYAPSRAGDPEFLRWMGHRIRYGASPSEGSNLYRRIMQLDVRSALSALHVPTLVLYSPSSRASSREDAEYLAAHIRGSELIPIECPDHLFWATEAGLDRVVDAIRRFVTRQTTVGDTRRVLTTVLFTDLVDSTRRASDLGDRGWSALLDRYLSAARSEVQHHRGWLVKSTGDGILATFDGPTRAMRCALALRDHARREGLEQRAGLHTGEVEVAPGDVHGIAVHIASRLVDLAKANEVLVSGTVRDLSVGSELSFQSRGTHPLKGVPGKWPVHSAGLSEPVERSPGGEIRRAQLDRA
jgi:class 3 adenylate cyclase